MMRLCALLMLLALLATGCRREGDAPAELPTMPAGLPEGSATLGVIEQPEGVEPFGTPDMDAEPALEPAPEPPPDAAALPTPESAPPAPTTRFSNLRFAPTGDAAPQANFPLGADQVCAIWDFRDMVATDQVRRVWIRNDAPYVERNESWDLAKYGPTGVVTDICLYDRIDGYVDGEVDGMDPGAWRVELYLNGELQLAESFTVGAP